MPPLSVPGRLPSVIRASGSSWALVGRNKLHAKILRLFHRNKSNPKTPIVRSLESQQPESPPENSRIVLMVRNGGFSLQNNHTASLLHQVRRYTTATLRGATIQSHARSEDADRPPRQNR